MTRRFVCLYSRGPQWMADKSVFEQALAPHVEYMKGLARAGTLLAAGPFLDDTGGLAIVSAESLDAARALFLKDPAVESRVMAADVRPWKPLHPKEFS
jgi:uncharacterized protein YciI